MIVRISTENQYRVPDEDADRLRKLDDDLVEAVESDDEDGFYRTLESMINLVRTDGEPLGDDSDLVESDVIMPPADTSFSEAKAGFGAEGLIPD